MLLFTNILFYLETKDWIRTIAYFLATPFFLIPVVTMYLSLPKFLENVDLDKIINSDPTQITNSHILPFILVSSGLNHYAAFSKSLDRMKEGTYKGQFLKHFFLKNLFIIGVILSLVIGYSHFNFTIVLALIIGKTALRLWNNKYREMF
jgi:hypothetical protein